jgi:glycosyltransferase involved in cell wall biosynthesis
MRIVLIAYHFPPDPAVGALRAAKLARAFLAAGHGVDVVTARLPAEAAARMTDDAALVVHPVSLFPGPRDIAAWMTSRLWRRRREGTEGMGSMEWTAPAQVPDWKRFLSALIWLPDDRQGFILPAWQRARQLVRAGGCLVYTTAPPYSTHLVGLALKLTSRVDWALELRDPWADNDQKPWWVRTHATDALDARLEALCLRHADRIVTVSEGIRERLLARLPAVDGSRTLVVRNGIDDLTDSVPRERRPGPVRIVYAGTFYYSRDPRPFLRALAAVCRKRRLGPEHVCVDFIGACRTIGTVSVEREINNLELGAIVRIQDWLPHAAARAIVDDADVLLLLAQQQPSQVPNKLYEYLGTRRQIIAFADESGETARMLRRVGGHRVVTGDDRQEVERVLEEILAAERGGDEALFDETALKEWTTEVQMQQLLIALRPLL